MSNQSSISFSEAEKAYAQVVTEVVAQILPGLARALAPRTEVLLHDFTKFPNSIVAIEGSITGRVVGGPPTDRGVRVFAGEAAEDKIGYGTDLGDGTLLKSSTLFFRYPVTGTAVASLCMNADVTSIEQARDFLTAMAALSTTDVVDNSEATRVRELFPGTVDALAEGILREAIASTGVPIALMKKRHKLDVVRELEERGFFILRESVDLAAKSLQVSRFSVYNYLNEIQTESE